MSLVIDSMSIKYEGTFIGFVLYFLAYTYTHVCELIINKTVEIRL